MADIIQNIFKDKKLNLSKLVMFGFENEDSCYVYRKILTDSNFLLTVRVTVQGSVSAEITDPDFCEPYTLHLTDTATGSFVGNIKIQYEETLKQVADRCFECNVFKSKQAKDLIEYVRNTYGDELEFLWDKSPGNAIWRRKDTKKWYGALLTVSKRRVGINSDEKTEILDLRVHPDELDELIDYKTFFPGYHMNKKHWYTVILDGSANFQKICRGIDKSYLLAVK